MFRLKNADGTLGALVGEEVDISEAEIISDATSEIKGRTTLKGGPFILNNAKIEDCVIDTKTSTISKTEIANSTIQLECMTLEKSVVRGITAVDKEEKKAKIKIVSSSIKGDDICFDFRGKSTFLIIDSNIKGKGDFICLDSNVQMVKTKIENLQEIFTNPTIGIPNCNFFFDKNDVEFENVLVTDAGEVLCKPGDGLKIRNTVIKNVFCSSGGGVEDSVLNGVFVSWSAVSLKKLETDKKTEVAILGVPSVFCTICNTKIRDSARIRNRYTNESTVCSLDVRDSVLSEFSVTFVTKDMKIHSTKISDNAIVEGVNLFNTTIRDDSKAAGVTLEKSSLSKDAYVGYDPFGDQVGNSSLLFFNGISVSKKFDLFMYKTNNNAVVVFKSNWNLPLLFAVDKKTQKSIGKNVTLSEEKIMELAHKVAEKFPDSVFADTKFDTLNMLSNSIKEAEKQFLASGIDKNIVKNVITYEFVDALRCLSKSRPKPPQKAIEWLNNFSKGAKVNIRTKEIVGYDTVIVSEILERLK